MFLYVYMALNKYNCLFLCCQYGHTEAGGVEHVPPGWNYWVALVRLYIFNLSATKLLQGSSLTAKRIIQALAIKLDLSLKTWTCQVNINGQGH